MRATRWGGLGRGGDGLKGAAPTLRGSLKRPACDKAWALWSPPRSPARRESERGWGKVHETARAGRTAGLQARLEESQARNGREKSARRALSTDEGIDCGRSYARGAASLPTAHPGRVPVR